METMDAWGSGAELLWSCYHMDGVTQLCSPLLRLGLEMSLLLEIELIVLAKSDVAAELQVPKKYLDCLNIYIVKLSFDVSFTLVFVICCKLVAAVLRRQGIKESEGFQQRLGRNSRLKLLTACCGNIRT